MKIGDYVLATKYKDGDSKDLWAIGFYSHQDGDRYYVVDNNGKQFRLNGFRRIKKITEKQGEYFLANKEAIELSNISIWSLLKLFGMERK